jgi:hypothetical protein
MNLFNLKNTDAYTINLEELLAKKEDVAPFYYIGISSNNIIHMLIPNVGEITFNRGAAKFLVEQLQFYIGEDDDNQ